MNIYKHWCGNCQIKIYEKRHYGRTLTWRDCPYTCEYATAMRCSTEAKKEDDLIGRQERVTPKKVEFIEVYIKVNDSDYQWCDNHGELVRCKDCKWFGKVGCAVMIADDSDKPGENDYCSFAERRE